MAEDIRHKRTSRRPEMINFTLRIPVELYRRLPVQPAKSSGKRGTGISGYLYPLLVDAIERDLTAREQAV